MPWDSILPAFIALVMVDVRAVEAKVSFPMSDFEDLLFDLAWNTSLVLALCLDRIQQTIVGLVRQTWFDWVRILRDPLELSEDGTPPWVILECCSHAFFEFIRQLHTGHGDGMCFIWHVPFRYSARRGYAVEVDILLE